MRQADNANCVAVGYHGDGSDGFKSGRGIGGDALRPGTIIFHDFGFCRVHHLPADAFVLMHNCRVELGKDAMPDDLLNGLILGHKQVDVAVLGIRQ